MLKRRTVVAVAVEATYGVDQVPVSSTDSMLCYDVDPKPTIEDIERNPYRSSLSRLMSRKGVKGFTLTFKTEMLGSGTQGTAPAISPLIRACGYKIATDSKAVVYYPEDDQTLVTSCTVYIWMDGFLFKLLGCRGNLSKNIDSGKVGEYTITMEAKSWTKEEATFPTDGGYPTTLPATCVNCNFSIANSPDTLALPTVTLDSGNTLAKSMSINTASGVVAINISDRKMVGTINPEAVLASTADFFGKWQAGNKCDLQVTIGSDAGNTIKITAPRVIYTGVEFGERDGLLVHNIPFMCAGLTASINGTVDAGAGANTTTTIKDTSVFASDDNYNGAVIKFTSGVNLNSVRLITNVVGATGIATFWPELAAACTSGSGGDAFAIQNAELGIAYR